MLIPSHGRVPQSHFLPAAHFLGRCSRAAALSHSPSQGWSFRLGLSLQKQHIFTLGAGIRGVSPKIGNQPAPAIVGDWFNQNWLCTLHCPIPAGAAPHGSCSEPLCALGASLGGRDNPSAGCLAPCRTTLPATPDRPFRATALLCLWIQGLAVPCLLGTEQVPCTCYGSLSSSMWPTDHVPTEHRVSSFGHKLQPPSHLLP